MRHWERVKDIPGTALIIPKKIEYNKQLVGFHLALPMGFRDSASFLFISTETVTDIANATMLGRSTDPPHPLKAEAQNQVPYDTDSTVYLSDAHWQTLPRCQQHVATAVLDVYLDGFISLIQGGDEVHTYIIRHLFQTIDCVFCPNGPA